MNQNVYELRKSMIYRIETNIYLFYLIYKCIYYIYK